MVNKKGMRICRVCRHFRPKSMFKRWGCNGSICKDCLKINYKA